MSSTTGSHRSISSRKSPAAGSACSTTTATAGSTSMSCKAGHSRPGRRPSPSRGDRLFRNRGDGTFEDVTETSGMPGTSRGYGHGVAVGDYDNDGQPDLFVTRWRSYALYRNRGDGTFEDVDGRGRAGGRSRLADLGGLRRPGRRRRPRPLRLPLPRWDAGPSPALPEPVPLERTSVATPLDSRGRCPTTSSATTAGRSST